LVLKRGGSVRWGSPCRRTSAIWTSVAPWLPEIKKKRVAPCVVLKGQKNEDLSKEKRKKKCQCLKKKPDPIQVNTCQNEKAVLFIFSFSFQEDRTCAS
jgi:hypothetical protein